MVEAVSVSTGAFGDCSFDKYICNKIRKAQNEHLSIVCQNLVGNFVTFKANIIIFCCLYHCFFYLETIGVS